MVEKPVRRLRHINMNSLRVAESAARLGSFTLAGEENLITASAVSQRIKQLEEQLEFKVFHRRNNKLSLTSSGEEFIVHIREALDVILSASAALGDRDKNRILKICVLPTFAIRWLLPKLKRFQASFPDIILHISQSYKPIDFLMEDFDIEIRYGTGNFFGLYSAQLFREDLIPVCSPLLLESRSALVDTSELSIMDLKHFTLIHSGTCTLNWKSWLDHVGASGVLEEAPSVYFDSCMLSFEAAVAGLGFAVANRAYVASDIKAGRLVAPFDVQQPNLNGWHVVYPRAHGRKEKVRLFEEWIREEASGTESEIAELTRRAR